MKNIIKFILFINILFLNTQVFASDIKYLSDIKPKFSKVGYSKYKVNQDNDGKKISLLTRKGVVEFENGIFAHAPSELIYDISSLDFDFLSMYLGINSRQNGSVQFFVYLDNKIVYSSKSINKYNSTKIALNIKDKKELKIIIDPLGSNAEDHSVIVDPVFIKNDKIINYEKMYDNLLNTVNSNIDINLVDSEYMNKIINQATFLKNMSIPVINEFVLNSEDNELFIDKILNDVEILNLINKAGKINNNYNFISILKELVEVDNEIWNSVKYKKLAVAVASEHSEIKYFFANSSKTVDPIERYKIFKNLWETGGLRPIFDTLDVEFMRSPVGAEITNEDLLYIRDRIEKDIKAGKVRFNLNSNDSIANATYSYIKYTLTNPFGVSVHAGNTAFYGADADLARVIEYGGVCGAVSKFDVAVLNAYGVPAEVIGQPGHAAVYYMRDNASFARMNQIYSLGKSQGGTITFFANDSSIGSSNYNTSYNILARDAKKDIKKYEKVFDLYNYSKLLNDVDKIKEVRMKIIEILPEFYPVYKDMEQDLKNSNNEQKVELANIVFNNLYNYPKPMQDLTKRLKKYLVNDRNALFDYYVGYIKAYNKFSGNRDLVELRTEDEYLNEINEANTYFGKIHFEGINKYQIINSRTDMEYSLDAGKTYSPILYDNQILTKEELSKLNILDGIYVRLKGKESFIKLLINKNNIPKNVRINSYEKTLLGVNKDMEYTLNGKTYLPVLNDFPYIDKDVRVRYKAKGNYLPSEDVLLQFDDILKKGIILQTNVSIDSYSSYEPKISENCKPENAINGNIHDIWHTQYNGGDRNPFLALKFDREYTINKIIYTPRQFGNDNGKIKKLDIYGKVGNEFKLFEKDYVIKDPLSKSSKEIIVNIPKVSGIKLVPTDTVGIDRGFVSIANLEFYTSDEESDIAREETFELKKQEFSTNYNNYIKSLKSDVINYKKFILVDEKNKLKDEYDRIIKTIDLFYNDNLENVSEDDKIENTIYFSDNILNDIAIYNKNLILKLNTKEDNLDIKEPEIEDIIDEKLEDNCNNNIDDNCNGSLDSNIDESFSENNCDSVNNDCNSSSNNTSDKTSSEIVNNNFNGVVSNPSSNNLGITENVIITEILDDKLLNTNTNSSTKEKYNKKEKKINTNKRTKNDKIVVIKYNKKYKNDSIVIESLNSKIKYIFPMDKNRKIKIKNGKYKIYMKKNKNAKIYLGKKKIKNINISKLNYKDITQINIK